MTNIDKQLLEHLLGLSKLEIKSSRQEGLLEDLQSILGYVEQLNEVDIKDIEPMKGGTLLINEVREDEINIDAKKKDIGEAGRIIESFPNEKDGYLKTPPVF